MTDREKVIKGLEHCSEDGCKDCPYESDCMMCAGFSLLAKDALERLKELEPLELLKELESVKPEVYCVGQDKYKFYRCPACKTAWFYKGNYCLGCGRPVKWE